jgi:outer membrane lipoprotein-sorting protein
MKKSGFSLLTLVFLLPLLPAVTAQGESNDPKAVAILEKIKNDYKKLAAFQMDYTLTIQFADQPADVQKGSIIKKGDAFHVKNGQQTIVSDGQTIWVHLVDLNEIQILDAGDESIAGMLDPEAFMDQFVTDQFVYAVTHDGPLDGRQVTVIEFKPTDKRADVAKMRMTVNKTTGQILEAQAFQKDGSRYTLQLAEMDRNPTIPNGAFTYDTKRYPDAHIEDLRM